MNDVVGDKIISAQQKKQLLLWRCAAVFFFVTSTAIFLCRYYFFAFDIQRQSFFPFSVHAALYGVTIAGALILVIFPLKLRICVFFAFLWGVVHLVEGKSILGLFFYLLAGAAAYQIGLFRRHRSRRISVYCVVFAGATTVQVAYASFPVGALLLRYLEYILGLGFGVLLFLPEIKRMHKERREAVLHLSSKLFTERDAVILQRVLAGEKYASIANDLGIAEITLKKHIRNVYICLGVDDRITFLARYSNYSLSYEIDEW